MVDDLEPAHEASGPRLDGEDPLGIVATDVDRGRVVFGNQEECRVGLTLEPSFRTWFYEAWSLDHAKDPSALSVRLPLIGPVTSTTVRASPSTSPSLARRAPAGALIVSS